MMHYDPTDLSDLQFALPRLGFPSGSVNQTLSVSELVAMNLTVTDGHVQLPTLVLKQNAVENNLRVMSEFLAAHDALHAPHAKTLLAPQLLRRQLEAGAWGITVANTTQAAVAQRTGARNILIANQVVGRADVSTLLELISAGDTTITVQVDSPDSVAVLDRNLGLVGATTQLPVLVEVGWQGGRTGARGASAAIATAEAAAAAPNLSCVGVATYEGVVGHDRLPETIDRVDEFLRGLQAIAVRIADAGLFAQPDEVVVSAGGTRFVDRVVQVLSARTWPDLNVKLVCRPGCYLSYGHRAGPQASTFGPESRFGQLLPTAELWAQVLSVPEPGLAIVGVGKKNVGERPEVLIPLTLIRRDASPNVSLERATVTGVDDHHAYLRLDAESRAGQVGVGDLVGFGIKHPAALDRWRVVPVVDDSYRIVDGIVTFFS